MGVGAALLVLAAAEEGPTRRVLSLRPALFLGRISYSLYLVHFPLMLLVAPRLIHTVSPWSAPLLIAVLLPLSILVSVASYRLVERPSITWGNRVCRAWADWTGKRPLESRAGWVA
jgi:peptidoglycan/LPS O-acetylase OafA/YrhL